MQFRLPLVMAIAMGVLFAAPAHADDAFGSTECSETTCHLWAGTDGKPIEDYRGNPKPPTAPQRGNSARMCRIPTATEEVLCVDPDLGWLSADGCYYRSATDFVATPALEAMEATPGVAGSWYERKCVGISGSGAVVWRPDAAMGAVVPPSPEVVAQRAVSQLVLPSPVVEVSPGLDVVQTVGVPVWLWISGGWGPVSATAAVPGVSVTATARPVSVLWDFGSGGQIRCAGPGRAFRPGVDDPAAGSECSIAFARGSAGQPGGRFSVTVTVTWQVGWAGAGQSGEAAGLTSQTAASVAVGESQGLVLPGAGR